MYTLFPISGVPLTPGAGRGSLPFLSWCGRKLSLQRGESLRLLFAS